jgi:hypothetical protein
MLAYIPLIAGEVIAVSAVLITMSVARMLTLAFVDLTCYHKLLFHQYTLLLLQLHASINFWSFQFSICGFENHLIYTLLNETDYFHG